MTQKKITTKRKSRMTGMLSYIIAARNIRCRTVERKCLLQYYASNVNNQGTFFKSLTDISAETCLSNRFINEANKHLNVLGILKWVSGSKTSRRANHYSMSLSAMQKMADRCQTLSIPDAKRKARAKANARMERYRLRKKQVTLLGDAQVGDATKTVTVTLPGDGVTLLGDDVTAPIGAHHDTYHETYIQETSWGTGMASQRQTPLKMVTDTSTQPDTGQPRVAAGVSSSEIDSEILKERERLTVKMAEAKVAGEHSLALSYRFMLDKLGQPTSEGKDGAR